MEKKKRGFIMSIYLGTTPPSSRGSFLLFFFEIPGFATLFFWSSFLIFDTTLFFSLFLLSNERGFSFLPDGRLLFFCGFWGGVFFWEFLYIDFLLYLLDGTAIRNLSIIFSPFSLGICNQPCARKPVVWQTRSASLRATRKTQKRDAKPILRV